MFSVTSKILAFYFLLSFSAVAKADILGTAESFAVLAGSAVTNTGSSIISGNLGVAPGTAITGFPPGVVVDGIIHSADAVAVLAQNDANTAFNTLAGLASNQDLTGQDLGGLTLTPGVYTFSTSAQLTGTLTLNTLGDPEALFVFQIGSTLTTASNSTVATINGPNDCQIYWQIGSSATLGTGTQFKGNIVALTSITLATGASILEGRALALNGAVTLDDIDLTAGCTCILLPSSFDCNGNGVPDECDLSRGTSLDCNANGIPDECDIASGTSLDCNGNGVPDECDLASGTSLDCNANGIPDECDVVSGTSLDCNLNGVPDECDAATTFPNFTTCDSTPSASVGSSLTFQVCATTGTPGVPITLTLFNNLPAGATLTPPLPLTGESVCTTFQWTPMLSQVGGPVLEFFAEDANGCRVLCKMRILVTETILVFGGSYGSGQFTMFGRNFDTQLTSVRRAFPASETNGPAPLFSSLPTSYSVQVLRYNAVQYPQQAHRWSRTLTFTKDVPSQTVQAQYFGTANGMDVTVETFVDVNGQTRVRFPITVQ